MPDLFFSNEKEGHFHNIIMPNVYIRIFPNGSVLYSIRISLTLACPMNLKLYPLDKQTCSLRMASCKFFDSILSFVFAMTIEMMHYFFCSHSDGWTTADLVFLWKEGDPVQVVKNLHLPRFTLEKFLTDYCNSKTNTGKLPNIWIRWITNLLANWKCFPSTRRIQLFESWFVVQTWIFILFDPNLYSMLHVGHCVVGIILVGSRCCASPCISW